MIRTMTNRGKFEDSTPKEKLMKNFREGSGGVSRPQKLLSAYCVIMSCLSRAYLSVFPSYQVNFGGKVIKCLRPLLVAKRSVAAYLGASYIVAPFSCATDTESRDKLFRGVSKGGIPPLVLISPFSTFFIFYYYAT